MKSHYLYKFDGLDVVQVPILKDNYSYILVFREEVVVVDPGEAQPIIDVCRLLKLVPKNIINTHHHWDHTDGNLEVKEAFNCRVFGSKIDSNKIPGLTDLLDEGPLPIRGFDAKIITAPGHTLGHVLLHFEKQKLLFTGDVLFCGGCGRVFEGSLDEMYESLQKIKAMPRDTKIFCGHEYSINNLNFAEAVGVPNLKATRLNWQNKIANKTPTVPSDLDLELDINPFLRAKSAEEFSNLRRQKDKF